MGVRLAHMLVWKGGLHARCAVTYASACARARVPECMTSKQHTKELLQGACKCACMRMHARAHACACARAPSRAYACASACARL
eukprot:974475-Pleurochrysis_carterae.AAC.1